MRSVPEAVATGSASIDDQVDGLTRSLPLPVLTSSPSPRHSSRGSGDNNNPPPKLILFPDMSINDWRSRINDLDRELLRLLNERARIALKVGESKKEAGVSVCDHTREREVIERMCATNEGPLDDRAIIELYRAIIHESRRIQTRSDQLSPDRTPTAETDHLRVAFQGARGAFSEEAAHV